MEFMDRKNKSLPIAIREAQEGDIPFLFSSWLKSFRSGLMPKKVDNTIFFSEHHKLAERLLKRSKTLVATDPADPATIYGYLVFERIEGIFVLHYVYVKHTFRAMGVMRQLMAATEQDFKLAGLFSHMTEIMERLALKYNLVYHPYILINYNEITAPKAAEVAGAE
jgi:GNAT superfamily N-acetyltransferase